MPIVDITLGSLNHLLVASHQANIKHIYPSVQTLDGVSKAKWFDGRGIHVEFDRTNAKKVLRQVKRKVEESGFSARLNGIFLEQLGDIDEPAALPPIDHWFEISRIRMDGGTQPRAKLDESAIANYVEAMNSGAQFPPVILFFDGVNHWLADGFHRVTSAAQCGLTMVLAEVRQGTQRDAILYSVGTNAAHGLPRSNEDKRRAVMRLLEDEEWGKWSSSEIARKCKVSDVFVGNLRKAITPNVSSGEVTYKNKQGKVTTMKTANIGKRTGVAGYVFVNDGEEVMHEESGETMSLAEFDILKASLKAQAKRRKAQGGGGGERDSRTAAQVHGDSMASAIGRGYQAQVDRSRQRMLIPEFEKLASPVIDLMVKAIKRQCPQFAERGEGVELIIEFMYA